MEVTRAMELWSTSDGLAESKAKLTPLDQRAEPVKAETCGAVFAAKLQRSRNPPLSRTGGGSQET
jgi:hypothetical protein